jgi:uncharacterized membrane protein (UPF0182 family)
MRGTMLVIPIENTILYAEPLYLKATTSQMPELKRVIVSHGDSIAMEENLSQALNRLLGLTGRNADAAVAERQSVQQLGNRAFMHLQNAEKALQAGDWKLYGVEMHQLRSALQQMQQ